MNKEKIKNKLRDFSKGIRVKFNMNIPNDIKQIAKVFKDNKYQCLIVGGAVRDALLNKQPKDFDLATDALPDTVEQIMNEAGFRTLPTGKAFGVINVFTKQGEYEVATFRADRYKDDSLDGFKKYLKELNNGKYEEFLSKLAK
jgi:tRNA nucleotidyltransferase/poly(A) polymerase